MIDLHSHTLLSDGELLLSELVRRAEDVGYRVINISDHADRSNLDFLIPRVVRACEELSRLTSVKVIAGVEITHCPPAQIAPLVEEARTLGAQLVTVHGETISEPVAAGTNRAAIDARVDILAHPGLITEENVALAVKQGVHLEISARKGHCLANGHVATLARAAGAALVFGTDCHAPEDLVTAAQAGRVLHGAGLDDDEIDTVWKNAEALVKRALAGRRTGEG